MKLHSLLLAALLSSGALALSACGGSTSSTSTTTTTTTTPTVSNTGTYEGSHDSPTLLLCEDPPGLDPAGHGLCGQRFTLAGGVSFTVEGNTVTRGWASVYGWEGALDAPATIDANGNFSFGFGPGGFVSGTANVTNGVMKGRLHEGAYEWKYGEFTLYKK